MTLLATPTANTSITKLTLPREVGPCGNLLFTAYLIASPRE
jgi:hypothetical protein